VAQVRYEVRLYEMGDLLLTLVIGDIGGHAAVLEEVLRRVGANPDTGELPDGLGVIQVGDLVRLSARAGRESDRCVEIADRFICHSGSRWLQLIGNHEVACLGGPRMPAWKRPEAALSGRTIETLERWWKERSMVLAGVVEASGQAALVTHAGLTSGFLESLGTHDLISTAQQLNLLAGEDFAKWMRPGVLVSGEADLAADCIWADSGRELYPSWEIPKLPFSQVHGHSQLFIWEKNAWSGAAPSWAKKACEVHVDERQVRFERDGKFLLGIDWILKDPASVPELLPEVLIGQAEGDGSGFHLVSPSVRE